MSGNCELGRGLRTREKNATEGGAGRFEKTAPDAQAAPIQGVTVNGKPWTSYDKDKEAITLRGLTGNVAVTAQY